MNHSYRVIWNVVTSTWQAVAETAKGRGKSKSVAQGVAAATLLLAGAASAAGPLPTGGNIVAGSGAISQSGSTMTINQSTAKMAVNWDSFSVAQGNTVNFVQPSASAVALNRVLGSDVSVIQGAINANGQVFLLNPNGVLFTSTAQVNVGALMASTLNMSTQDFMNGNYKLSGDSSNAVINQGNITAVGDAGKGGAIALIAAKVINEGNLTANSGNVLLGAGSEVVLDLGGPVKLQVTQGAIDALVQNSGAIQADGGLIYLTAQAVNTLTAATINNTGVIRAQTLATGEKGEIRLMADMGVGTVNAAGTLDASAPNGGDGGFIETSGNTVHISETAQVTTLADRGQTGQWLIDPNNYTIAATGGNQTGAQVATSLNTTNVLIQTTTGGTGGSGDIFVNDDITKTGTSGTTTLTLQAVRNIDVNANITSTGSPLNITLSAANGANNGADSALGGVRLAAAKTLNSNGGTILIGGAGGSVAGAQTASHGIGYALNHSANEEAVYIGIGAKVLSQGGDITINGYSTKPVSGSNDTTGVHFGAGSVIDSGYYAPNQTVASSGGYINIAGRYEGGVGGNTNKVFGVKIDNPTGNSGETVFSASTTTGRILVDGSSTYDTAGAYALNIGNGGGAGNIYFTAYSVADLLFILNGGLKGVTFTYQPPNSGCRSGYPNCGLLSVNSSANNSYLYATYNAVNMSVLPIYVSATLTGTKVYDGTLTASNLNFADVTILDPNSSGYSSTNVTSATYTTPSANVGIYSNLSQPTASRTYLTNNKLYVLGYNFTASYSITPATASLNAVKTYQSGDYSFLPSQISVRGVNGETLSLAGNGPATAITDQVEPSNPTNYLSSMGGMTLANGTSGLRGLASNYVLPPLSARSAYNIATINPANLSIIGLSGTRYYDGTATFDANQLTLDGVQGTDSVVLSGSATVASRNVGTYTQWASSNLSLTGAGANNYTYTLNNGSVSAIITPRPLGINVTGIYNGTSNLTINGGALSASNAIFQYTGLVSGETITEVTIASPNVVRNGSNSVVSVTGSNNFDINNYQLGTSQVVSNNLPFNGDQTTTTPLVTTNAVWLKPAPLGVAVSGTYNGTTTMSTVNGAVITPYGLLGQDATGVSLTTATLSSPNLSVPGGNKVVAVTGTGTFDPNNYVLDSSVNATPATAGAALDGSGATNTVNLVEAPTVPPVVLQPPPAAPIIVPAFPDNGIKAIAIDTRPPEFGGMNYVAALFEGATPTSTSPTASGQTQGSAPTASTAPTEGGAMNYVSISSKVTDSGQELQVRLPEDKNRKPQSELNVNNTTVSSNTSPLDVFVVDTGINLSNLNNGK